MYGTNITQHSTFPDFTNHTLITQLFQLPTILVSNTHKHTQTHTSTHLGLHCLLWLLPRYCLGGKPRWSHLPYVCMCECVYVYVSVSSCANCTKTTQYYTKMIVYAHTHRRARTHTRKHARTHTPLVWCFAASHTCGAHPLVC